MRTALYIFVNCGLQVSLYLKEQETPKQVRTGEVISLGSLLRLMAQGLPRQGGLLSQGRSSTVVLCCVCMVCVWLSIFI